ncbi:SCO family protein [Novosphingobium jiangmenense]|uniref:SCO family protein n=1 Tax=Novosphingobium jiangmenense TaxID=2791981 RepID=A0ABS0HDZ2_9SPHN|nr:SCO family protein [Novosphingobium jiangmenense]MBF9150481.1 SCO family protein [Novosphingobium jiangmenense]
MRSEQCGKKTGKMRRVVLLSALLAFALIAGYFATGRLVDRETPRAGFDSSGRYRLIDQNRQLFDRASLKRRPYLTYFGYASCPDRCPAMLLRLARLRKDMGLSAEQLPILFITVDPERDTPERLAAFVKALNVQIIALTGPADVIHRVTDNAGVFVQVIEQEGKEARIEHTTSAFIYNRNGDFSDAIIPEDDDRTALRKLQEAVGAAPRAAASAAPARTTDQAAGR